MSSVSIKILLPEVGVSFDPMHVETIKLLLETSKRTVKTLRWMFSHSNSVSVGHYESISLLCPGIGKPTIMMKVLSVCTPAYLRNYTSKLHQIF